MKNPIIKSLAVVLVIMLSLVSSCVKDKDQILTADATVKNTGDPVADGCGWLLKIGDGNKEYKPDNLPFEFRVDNQKVHITYTLLKTRYQCGLMPVTSTSGIPNIHINAISK